MPLEKKSSFVKQISIFLQGEDYEKAFALSEEFSRRFDREMVSHYLLAQSAFRMGRLDIAESEGRKAYSLSKDRADMAACAVFIASVCYLRKEYPAGMKILSGIGGSQDAERLMVVLSLAMDDANSAARHLDELYKMNIRAARKLAVRMLKG